MVWGLMRNHSRKNQDGSRSQIFSRPCGPRGTILSGLIQRKLIWWHLILHSAAVGESAEAGNPHRRNYSFSSSWIIPQIRAVINLPSSGTRSVTKRPPGSTISCVSETRHTLVPFSFIHLWVLTLRRLWIFTFWLLRNEERNLLQFYSCRTASVLQYTIQYWALL